MQGCSHRYGWCDFNRTTFRHLISVLQPDLHVARPGLIVGVHQCNREASPSREGVADSEVRSGVGFVWPPDP